MYRNSRKGGNILLLGHFWSFVRYFLVRPHTLMLLLSDISKSTSYTGLLKGEGNRCVVSQTGNYGVC